MANKAEIVYQNGLVIALAVSSFSKAEEAPTEVENESQGDQNEQSS